MNRPKWKGPFVEVKTIKQLKKNNNIYIVSRNSEISPQLLGFNCKIHNGKSYNDLIITEDMLGHKFGEFAFTRAKFIFKKKKTNKKKIQSKK